MDTRLQQECRTFTRYLAGGEASPYIEGKYATAHGSVLDDEPALPLDRAMVDYATRSPLRTRIADAYGRIFRPHGLLRRKLVYLLAVLESSREHHRSFTCGGSSTVLGAVGRISIAVAAFLAALSAGADLLGPRHFLAARAQ